MGRKKNLNPEGVQPVEFSNAISDIKYVDFSDPKVKIVRFRDAVPISSANEMCSFVYVGQEFQGKPVQIFWEHNVVRVVTNVTDYVPLTNIAGMRGAE